MHPQGAAQMLGVFACLLGGSCLPENEFSGEGMGEASGGGDRHMAGEAREGCGEGDSRGEGRYCLR